MKASRRFPPWSVKREAEEDWTLVKVAGCDPLATLE